jgi:filamentous hemagglutinin family protein
MNKHASINRVFRLIWNDALGTWVPVAETTRGRGKRSGRNKLSLSAAALLVPLAAALASGQPAEAAGIVGRTAAPRPVIAVPALTPTTLPTGGVVSSGSATIAHAATAVLDIDQTTERAVIDWNTFNLGSAAQVDFVQPNSNAATLNRVLDSNPSQIFGKITATGQIFLSNPNGVYFGKSASVDVGSLAATTNSIGDVDFMADKITLTRNGATGSVVNDGSLHAGIGGYVALLAPNVRNSGVVVAHMGTVVLAAGDSITLNFDGSHLAGITAQPATIAALVENKSAVIAPGGLIILSAQALDRLQGGVVKNSGALEATGMSAAGGRIVLEANTVEQTTAGTLDAAGASGGSVQINASQGITLSGTVSAAAAGSGTGVLPGRGGSIALMSGNDVTLQDAVLDVSGSAGGGHIDIRGGDQAAASPTRAPTVSLQDGTTLRASSTLGQGGNVTMTADHVGLFDTATIDASGATGGGDVFIGGGFHGKNSSIADAQQVVVASTVKIDASATHAGTGGNVAVWSDVQTSFGGSISARGGAASGAGGFVEVSSTGNLNFLGTVDAKAAHGTAGTLLLDPTNIIVATGGGATLTTGQLTFAANVGADSTIDPGTITTLTNAGTAVTLQASNDLTINNSIITSGGGVGGALVFQAGRSIAVNASVISNNGNISFIANDPGASTTYRAGGVATFANNSVIDAGSGNVSITMDAYTFAGATSGTVSAGHIAGAALSITQRGPTTGATSGAIDLGETNLTGNLTISANSDRNVTNALGTSGTAGEVVVRGTATIGVGTGSVAINGPNTDFNIIGLTAGNVTLNDTNAVQFGATNVSGTLTETSIGPIASTGSVQAAGLATFTSNNGGFGYADPYISLTNAANHFGGGLVLSVPNRGATLTGGYAVIVDSGAITLNQSNTATSLQINAGGATVLGATGATLAGTNITVSTSTGAITANTTTATTGSVSLSTSSGAVTTGTTTAGGSFTVAGTGAVSLGTSTVGVDLSVNTNAAITSTGALTVSRQTTLTAGSTNDITLNNANNDFSSMYIVSANNATLVDKTGINFGAYCGCGGFNSHIYGNLMLTAGGDISQTGQSGGDGYSAITVGGATTFTASAATQTNLYLGSTDPFSGNAGESNVFTGGVTLARTNTSTGGFSSVDVRDANPSASVLTGLTTVGTLSNVSLRYDNAPSVSLPGMTVTGSLKVNAPNVANTGTTSTNIISQTGPIVVGGITMVQAASTGDIVLTNAGNDFTQFGVLNGRNTSIVDLNAIVLYGGSGYNMYTSGALNVTTNGAISDLGNAITVGGAATFNAGVANNISLTQPNNWNIVAVTGKNVIIQPNSNLILGNSTIAGTLTINSYNSGFSLSQVASSAVNMTANGVTTFNSFLGGITLAETGNVFGPLAIAGSGAISIRENDAITQASAWTNYNGSNGIGYAVTLTTSNDQAITMGQSGNYLGSLTVTQVNAGASSAGAVYIRETADNISGMTQAGPWTVHGTATLDSGAYSINLNNVNNVLGPLQVTGATGSTGSTPVASTVTIYAKNTATTNAITDVGGTGPWATGAGIVKLIAYDLTGSIAGGGNITLTNLLNVTGNLYLKAVNATITENNSITDGVSASWDAAGDTGWMVTGTANLVVANPAGKSITLANTSNQIGPIGITTSGTGTLSSVLVTDNANITQASIWSVGVAPVTLDARTHTIDLSSQANVLGPISINTANGTPSAVAITENDAITQGSVWNLPGVPITLVAQNANAITLTTATNLMGALTITSGAASITENGAIVQGATAWTTTGVTTLNVSALSGFGVTLTNANNALGPIAIAGTPNAVSITENADITQASAWLQASTPFTLKAGTHDILLSQSNNQLGDLTLTAQNATVTENNTSGITDGGAWTISGTTTLTAGAGNPIVLNANPASDLGTVSIVSASNADINDINGIIFGASTIAGGGTLTVTAGGAITQSGAITATNLRLIGTGSATLTNIANNVTNLAAGFSGGDLSFTNGGTFAAAVVGGTSVNIGAHNVTLTSATGTVTGLSNVNSSSSSLTVTSGTALSLGSLSIAGAQTYTGSTVSGSGILLTAGLTSTAAGAISFMSPVTLGADLTVQSTNSAINFSNTLAGASYQLGVNAGSGLVNFQGAVTAVGRTSAGPALTLTSGLATFSTTLSANNGLAITGPVIFNDTVTLGNGGAASVFTGLVTLGKAGGMNLSGYNNMSFDGGVLLQNGSATINSNNSPLVFQTGAVSGPYALTLTSGTASLSGLDQMGPTLTSLTVTALSPTIPSGGVSIAGPQTYNASGVSSITLGGNVTSTAAGVINFNGPVTMGANATVASSNSAVAFGSTVDGNKNLTVNSGSAATTFTGAVGSSIPLGTGTGAAIVLQETGATTFDGTVQARSGMTAVGPVIFDNNVALTSGNTGSVFAGLVTTGGASGDTISGYGGIAFDGGLALVGGPVSIASNGSTLSFGGAVSGAQSLTLNALAGAAGTITGLSQIGFTSNLTALTVTAQTLSLPGTGLAVAGPMAFTAAGGITVNGAVGNNSAPATGTITFNSPVTLATGAIAITTANAPVIFNGTVDGAETLAVNAGSGATTFGAAVGATTALTSVTTDAGGTTAINGGSIRTTAAQTYNDPITLGADTTLTGVNVRFAGTLNGAHALTVNDSGTTTFAGLVGGTTPLTSITTDAAGSVAVNTTAVTTSAAQTYNENMTLGANTTFTGVGLTFGGSVDGAYGLTASAGTGAARFVGAVGGTTPLTSLTTSGFTAAAATVTTSGAQSYTAAYGVTLSGNLGTMDNNVLVTGPTTLGGNVTIASTGGNITFSGTTSTINGAYALTLTAGAGNVVLGGAVGGITPLTSFTDTGNDLTLPAITTVNDANQTYTALDNITLNQSRTLNAPVSFTADSDGSGVGSFILSSGVSLTASNNTLSITAADIQLSTSSTLSSGSGLMSITATDGRNIALGGAAGPIAGQMTITGTELSHMTSAGGLNLNTTGAGWIAVNGISAAQSTNVTGTLGLNAGGTGAVSFITAASTFKAVTADAVGGLITIGVNLTTSNPIEFVTPVSVSGASTINSGGGNISFDSTLAVANSLTLTTGNGTLTFGDAVGSNQTLTLNLGGGAVAGLGELQSTLTGLTVNGTAGITLPAFTIAGPQVYNTGTITATGNLGGIGIAFNNLVNVVPAGSATALTLNAGTGVLAFNNQASFNANDMTLTADQINFAGAVTGHGSLTMQPATLGRNVAVGGNGTSITLLNLTTADLGWLPIGTLTGVTIGTAAGTGSLDVAGALNLPGTPVTLIGGGGITQSGGSITSGPLTLFAAGNAITLANGANAFGAVGLNGSPSAVNLVNTSNITQLGSSAWNLGNAPVTLNSGTHDITLNNAGNTFGTLVLNGGNVQVTEAAATDIGVSSIGRNLTVISGGGINLSGALTVGGNVSLTSSGVVTQAAPLTIVGNLAVMTTVAAGDVTVNNSGAAATSMGDTFVGGDYVLTATGAPVTQAAGASLQVAGNLTVTGSSIVLGGAGNIVGGTTTLPATNTAVVTQAGVITLGNRTDAGNLTVISARTNRTVGSAPIHGSAIVLNNASNNITGSISVSASPPTITTGGADVQTGIVQTGGTSISVAGVASFTAEPSAAGSLGIVLTNTGNNFGTLVLSGNTVNVANSATGLTTIGSALATTSLTLTTAGGLAQSGSIVSPAFRVNSNGAVTLNNTGNDVASIAVVSAGNGISYIDANDVSVAGIDAGGATVSLTAGGAGSLTQTSALLNVSALSANAGGAVTLTGSGNTIATLAASTAGTGLQILDSTALGISGIASTTTGTLSVRTSGDLTLNTGGRLEALAGNLVASTEGAGNFINNSSAGAAALVVGAGDRWLVYSDAPDLVSGAHTVKGGLTSSFRHYGVTYATYAPGSVSESGDGFIYSQAAGTLTVSAIINGTPSQVYGNAPTGTLGYTISAGRLDSEDTTANVISGGTALYSGALSNTMNAGSYSFTYTGGLTSSYTLTADTNGVAYTVTPAVLTYAANTASRAYGAANPALSGAISGYKLSDGASVLSGSATWTTAATAASSVGHYAITGAGYSLVSGTNYTFAQAGGNSTAFTVGTAGLTVTATNATKAYDGLLYSGGNGVTYSAFANGESASDLGGALAYSGTSQGARNVGGYVITPGGLTSGNYAITYTNGTLTVGKAAITLSTSPVTKVYNGTLAAVGSATVSSGTLFTGDTLSGGTFAFTNANAGTGNKTVSVSAVTMNDTNGGGNYTISYAPNVASTITPAGITVSASNVTKTYDGSLSATGTATVVAGSLYHNVSNGGTLDSISGGSIAFTDANAGTGNKTVSVSGATVNDGNGGGNYALTYANNTTSTINQATLTFLGTVTERAYDGTVLATLSGYTLSGLVGTQTLSASDTSATFADKNAATGKTVTIGGITIANGTNGGLASNYHVATAATASGIIDPKLLTVNATVANKVYDRTTGATLTGYGLSGFVGTETVIPVYTGSATFIDKNVGTAKAVTITGINLLNGTNGGLANNYAVAATATGSANITPATLHVAGVVSLDKVYDGTLTANMNTQAAVLTGVIGADIVQVGSITGTYQTKDVGINKPIGTGSFVLSGTDAGDYTLVQPSGLTSSITPRALTVSATGVNKVYDTTTNATATLTDNRIAGDSLTITSTDAFMDKNVGSGKYVSISNIAISGTDARDYTANTNTATGASITKANLTEIVTGVNKVYDATTADVVTITASPLSGDVVDLSSSTAAFADKNVGNAKTVTVSGIAGSGADAGNYQISTAATTTANITPATIARVTGVTAANKVYDGTTTATLVSGTLGFVGIYSGDVLTATATDAVFNDKNAGTGKIVTIGGLVLAGADAANYVLTAAGTTASAADITPRSLAVSATGVSKVYDGTTAAAVNLTDNRIAGDSLNISSTDAFLDKNAGNGKYITVASIALSGSDAGNYTANGSASTVANITPAVLTVIAVGANKVYDATSAATVTLTDAPLAGDVVDLNYVVASFGNKNVGAGKVVTVSGVTGSGADAGNYAINPTALSAANITPATLTVAAAGNSKAYDGNVLASVTLTDNAFAGDQLSLADAGAAFANPAVGNGKIITVAGIRIGGADQGNYVLAETQVDATGSITGNVTGNSATLSSLPPMLPQPVISISVPAAPASVLDLTLPDHFVLFGSATSTDGIDAGGSTGWAGGGVGKPGVPAAGNDQVTVSLVQAASAPLSGAVSVSVPGDLVSSGKGFSFSLPQELLDAAIFGDVQVTRTDGKRLPSWLRFVKDSKTFKAAAVPAGALPIYLLVSVGTQQYKMSIVQR